MKFRNIYILCKENYDAIEKMNSNSISINGRSGIKVSGWGNASYAVTRLMEADIFKKQANLLIESIPVFYRTRDSFEVTNEEWKKIISAKNELLKIMNTVMLIFGETGQMTEERMGLDIKLPKYNDFSEFAEYIRELDFIFTKCPFVQDKEERITFENVDIGSTWLTFFLVGTGTVVGGSILLNNIVAFIDKCIILRSHYLSYQKQKNDLEIEKRNEDEKQTILSYISLTYTKEVDSVIKELETVTGHEVVDADEQHRIRLSMEKMGFLIDKGLQIYSSIDSPAEVKVLFEPLKMKYIEIGKKIELLEDKEK